ncbi:MAG: HD domain-containing protein [Clostridia bacterium]|nr:HD domain-containing protein [Clostridia bacterium]
MHHHAYIGGLLEHSLAVCKRSLALAELSMITINKDLLVIGSLLHDIGKIYSYEYDKPPIRLSSEGKLLEHIVIGLNLTSDAYKNTMPLLDKEDYLHLQHMIASHHGKLEWGSPIVPKIIEAEILHTADNLDAIDFKYNKAVQDKSDNQEWSDWIKGLGKEVWVK